MINTKTMVVIAASTFQSPIHITMCESFKKLFKPEDMTMRSLTDDPDVQKERLMKALVQSRPTALIAMSIRPDIEIIENYKAANAPIIITDENMAGVSSITTDNFLGGKIAGDYLIKKGRKKLAIVTGRTKVKGGYNAEQRLKGFQEVLNAGKMHLHQSCIVEVPNYSREDGLQVMPLLLNLGVDAIFCAAGDNCATGLLSVARDRGIRVPEDVAIIGFDDLRIARLSTPAITTIRQPLQEMVETAYKMAVTQHDEILKRPQNVVLQPDIVIRKSA